jgi:hypothetical protein
MFADEDFETQNFWASFKSQVATPIYACIFVVITMVGPTKVRIIKLKCTVLNRMWQHDYDEANIIQFNIFVCKHRLTG